ncbi:MAG TPA: YnbE family lipoprotein [Myxococcota bacterium]|nr:YnbE family lipoprotein [Myxococcota bacterium]
MALCLLASALALACTPKVAVEAPKEPIVINMNVKIDHEIRVKVEDDLDHAIANDKEIF